jgi:hypothetical protein
MGLELPAVSAIIARLEQPEINLAAYGGIVFPIALIIESPIIMLLSASTALSKDLASYCKIRNFMISASAILTTLHALVAFTPLYYFVVERVIGVPVEIIDPGRVGLMIMLPWTWAIAYRRHNQGLLIRFSYSRIVSAGTAIRLISNMTVLIGGFLIGRFPGIVVATSAVACGVTVEAIFIGLMKEPILRNELTAAPDISPPLSYKAFFDFYIPLALTSLLVLIIQPIGSAALSRMPLPLESLAVWPVVTGIIFLLRGMGIAFNEVVLSLIDEINSYEYLKKFTAILSIASSITILVMNITPLAWIYFSDVSALPIELTKMAIIGLWIAIPMPGLNTLQSWYQGVIMQSKKTRGITEAVVIFIFSISIMLWIGVAINRFTGLFVGVGAYGLGMAIQTYWLWYRSRNAMEQIRVRDNATFQ